MKNIAVFFGGQSVEREVSVITGVLTLNSIDKTKYNPIPVYITADGGWYTGESLFDIEFYKAVNLKKLTRVTFKVGENVLQAVKKNKLKPICSVAVGINCIHGEKGEDGCLSGFLKLCDVPFSSPDLFASSTFMDKEFTKIFLKGIGVKCLPYVTAYNPIDAIRLPKRLSYPVIIKPVTLGSSIGIKIAWNNDDLKSGILYALRYANKVIIEKYLKVNTEINCAVYKEGQKIIVSECEQPVKRGELLGFDDKYVDGGRVFPANIGKEISDKAKKISKSIYEKSGANGVIRIDFLVANGEVYVNEINGVPGSLAYYLFCDTTAEFSKIITALITTAEQNHAKEKTVVRKFSSSVLNITGIKGLKHLKKP